MTQVYFTKNTEYHVHEGICVRVLRRKDGRRLSDHRSVGASFLGGVRFPTSDTDLSSRRGRARVGDVLVFDGDEGMVMSTTVELTQVRDDAGEIVETEDDPEATWRKRLG